MLGAVLLVAATGAANTPEPWRLESKTGVLEHIPSGLRFPMSIGDLRLLKHSAGQNPYAPEAASLSYGSTDLTLVVTLIPVSKNPENAAEKLFEARKQLFLDQQPRATPMEVASMTRACPTAASATHMAAFDLDSERVVLYSTAASGHVVYVRVSAHLATEGAGQNEKQFVDFLLAMRWPCHAAR